LREYARRLRIWETDYGRDAPWVIERHGHPIALLTEPRWEAMFWHRDRIEITTEDPDLRIMLLTEGFWAESEELVWRNHEFRRGG
jgi:hypothetical protein